MTEFVLDDFSEQTIKLIPASKGKRFANYLIDFFFLYLLAMLCGLLYFIFLDTSSDVYLEEDVEDSLLFNVISLIVYVAYYFIFETFFKGKTLGKYLTKTRTVDIDGSVPTTGAILKRSFSRIVPFDAFSFLGSQDTGWHDRWSNTMVIDEKESRL